MSQIFTICCHSGLIFHNLAKDGCLGGMGKPRMPLGYDRGCKMGVLPGVKLEVSKNDCLQSTRW